VTVQPEHPETPRRSDFQLYGTDEAFRKYEEAVIRSERRPPISLKPEKAGLKDLLVASATISVTA